MPLNEKQQQAFDLINEGKNIFLTGSAGTGKSFLINYLKEHLDVDVTASTGIAATNIGGMTVHSWAGIFPFDDTYRHSNKPEAMGRILNCSTLVIDEISMIDDKLLDYLNWRIQTLMPDGDRYLPFGGMQIVVVGDFMQLPPVGRSARYCFHSDSWKQSNFEYVKLTKVERQKEARMAEFLEHIRFKKLTGADYDILREIAIKEEFPDDYIKLYARNKECDAENQYRLKKNGLPIKLFQAGVDVLKSEHVSNHVELFFKNSLIDEEINLAVGARVMMLANDVIDQGISNGSVGIVLEMQDTMVLVKFDNGKIIPIGFKTIPITIKNPNNPKEPMTVAEVHQVPLRLAWAITIHKSQGMSLAKVGVDFRHIFAPFQAYVALSRCENLQTLKVKNMNILNIKTDPEAVDFMEKLYKINNQ